MPKTMELSQLCAADAEFARIVADIWEFDLPWTSPYGTARMRESLDECRLSEGRRWVRSGSAVGLLPSEARSIQHY